MQLAGPPRAKPQVLKAPSPQREVPPGQTAKLMVHIASNPPPRLTWYYNGRVIQQSQRFRMTYEQEIVTLLIYDVQPKDSGEYMLHAANDLGEVTVKTVLNIRPTQKTVQLTTTQPPAQKEITPVFTRPLPPEIRVRENTIAKLEAYIEAYPPPVITWHVNGSQIRPSPKYTIRHEGNKVVLLVKNITVEDSGTYTCKARSDLGETVTSTTLYVTGSQPRTEAPRFVNPLQNQTALDGKEVRLSCRVHGIPIPDIYWYLNDKSIDKNEDYVIEYDRATGSISLHIVDCLMEDSGVFKCVARNPAGQDVTQCTLQVLPEDQVNAQEVQRVHAVPAKRPAAVQRGSKEMVKQVTESEVDRTLHHKDIRVVKKIVKKQSGQPPKFTKPIQPQVVKEGDEAIFTAIVTGAPVPDITWLKDKVEVPASSKHIMTFDDSIGTCILRVLNANPGDVGVYSCRAENPAGKATCTANVVVVPPDAEVTITEKSMSVKKEKVTVIGEQETRIIETSPTFTSPLLPQKEVNEGDTVTFQCLLEAEPAARVQWFHNDHEILSTGRTQIESVESFSKLTLIQVGYSDEGEYLCRASNQLGEATTKTILHIKRKFYGPSTGQAVHTDGPIHPEITSYAQTGPRPQAMAPTPVYHGTSGEPCAVLSEAPRFSLPLRDVGVNDGDQAVFRVFFHGTPTPTITWYFNSRPVKPSRDFQIFIDANRGESTLVIVEVFPEDEGEYMVKAENQFGAAVTHCHLFVRLPSSSSSDEEVEKITTTQVYRQPIKDQRRFSETIAIAHQQKFSEQQVQFALPQRPSSRTELHWSQPATPQGLRMEVELPGVFKGEKSVQVTRRTELQTGVTKQRRYSETLAIDQTKLKPVEVLFALPKQSATTHLTVQQKASPRGVRMEVEVPAIRRELSAIEIQRTKQVETLDRQRQEVQLQVEGAAPKFIWELNPLKVMDGEEVKFICRAKGNPMPEVSWYHNGKLVIDNPDFRTFYDRKSGECVLEILEVFPQDTGRYECIAVNKYGRAVTRAPLNVEVYEYVPDSEEATASQTDVSTSSMDETEFKSKTQRFLEDMKKLRQEINEEMETQDYEEELVEELEIDEQGYEETVHMADVKWQYQKYADTGSVFVTAEVSHDTMDAPHTEQPHHEEIVIDIGSVHVTTRKPSQVLVQQTGPTSSEPVEELIAEGLQQTQQQEIQLQLQHPAAVRGREATRVITLKSEQPVEGAEELVAQGAQNMSHEEGARVNVEYGEQIVAVPTASQVLPMEEVHAPEVTEVVSDLTSETTHEEQIHVELSTKEIEMKPETRTLTLQTYLSEEDIQGLVDSMPSPTMPEHEEIQVILDASQVQPREPSRVVHVDDYLSPDEEEDIFFEAAEPALEGEDIPLEVTMVDRLPRDITRTLQQEENLPEEGTEEAWLDFTHEQPKEEEIYVNLGAAESQLPQPSQVREQLRVQSPITTEEIPDDNIHEEQTQGQAVSVDMATATAQGAQPALVQVQKEDLEVQETRADIIEYSEELAPEQSVPSELTASESEVPPPQHVEMVKELVTPDDIGEETSGSIKEVRMIPGYYVPEYEPSVVERYRMEPVIRGREVAHEESATFEQQRQFRSEVQLMTQAEEKKVAEHRVEVKIAKEETTQRRQEIVKEISAQIVRAIQEVSEVTEHVVEMEREEVERIERKEELVGSEQVRTVHPVEVGSLVAPVFEIPLSDVTVTDGERALLECHVSGLPNPTVTWYVDNQEIRQSQDIIITYEDGYCGLEIVDTLLEDEGEYQVTASNEAGTCETTAYLTVLPPSRPDSEAGTPVREETFLAERRASVERRRKEEVLSEEMKKVEVALTMQTRKTVTMPTEATAPEFTKRLESKDVFEGLPVRLECEVIGYPVPEVTWYQDGHRIESSDRLRLEYKRGRCVLYIEKVVLEDEGEYLVEARNQHGVSTSWMELLVEKLISAVEQVVVEEYYEVEIEMHFKWRQTVK